MTSLDYEILDNLCEKSLTQFDSDQNLGSWIIDNKELFDKISIKPSGLPSIANSNHFGILYVNISIFHRLYNSVNFKDNH